MNELALFAGAGGGILGGILCGFRTVCAVEIEPYCREVLLRRQRDRVLPLFPIWDDVRTFNGCPWRGLVDVITAGFPCQPFSVAGKKRGADDPHNMWPDTIRVIREVGPRFACLENVPGLVATDYFGTIIGDLAEAGLDAEWTVVSAAECGAPHRRERLWILAYPVREGLQERHSAEWQPQSRVGTCDWWATESGMVRVVHGIPNRVHRIRALGNAQVPRVAQEAWERLMARAVGRPLDGSRRDGAG